MGFLKSSSTSKAEKINNFQATVCEYGTPVPDLVGTVKVNPNVINWTDFYAQELKTTQKSGKHKHTQIDYRYFVYMELALSESITGLGKIWAGSKEFASLTEANASGAEGFPLVLHKNGGKSDYMASTYPDKAMDYKELAYLCSKGGKWNGTYLGENSASVPSYSFEVKGKLLDKGDGIDVNPADYILYLLERVGIYNGIDPEETVVEGIGNFRQYCTATDLLISSKIESSQKPVHEIIEELCNLYDIYFFWSNDRFKIAIKDDRVHGSWKPNKKVVFDLDNDDFLPQNDGASVIFSRKPSNELYNRFTLNFLNRENHYEEENVSYEYPEDIKKRGLNQKSSIDAKWFYKRERAIRAVEIQARKNKREQNKYKIMLDWAYAVLEPGDLVTLTDPSCGLVKQIAIVESVVEAEDGVVTVELMQYKDGEYEAAVINPGGNNDNYFDYNVEPSDTDIPFIFQPPSEAAFSGNELWIAVKGLDENWGGCNIYGAYQDSGYRLLNQHRQSAQYGRLLTPMTPDSVEFTAEINGDFENVTIEDAKNAGSLFYIDGECLSYTAAKKNSDGSWTFSGLVRGQYSTGAQSHSAGVITCFCNGALFVIELTKKDFGRRAWFRFPSINIFASNPQDVSEAAAYSYLVQEYGVPGVKNINAYTRYISTENSVSYSIQVEWTPPKSDTYLQSQVWYKREGDNWGFAAAGYNSVTIPNVVVGERYTIAVCAEDIFGVFTQPDNAPQVELLVMTKAAIPNAPENVGIKVTESIRVSWNFVSNADVRFYEVRTDANPGIMNGNFLGRSSSNSIIVNNIPRQGNIYVYAYGVTNKYSEPGIYSYNFPAPSKPTPPELSPLLGGFSVRTEDIPVGSHSVHVYVEPGDSYYTQNRVSQYNCAPGTYFVKYGFVDAFGEGTASEQATVTIKATIDPGLIESGSIQIDKLDQSVKDALEKAENGYTQTETDNAIVNAFTKFENEKLVNYSTITQTDEAIQLAVGKVDLTGEQILTRINLTDGKIQLDGKLTHITGDTLIDNNVIAKGQLQAGSVVADNLAAENIAMKGALNISGGSVVLDENGLNCALSNGDNVKFDSNGMSYVDSFGNIYSNISKMIVGIARHGDKIKFRGDWKEVPKVICAPLQMQTNVAGYSQVDLETICRAINVTSLGFEVECYTRVKSGASGYVPIGRVLIDKMYDHRDPDFNPPPPHPRPGARVTKEYSIGKAPVGATKCVFVVDGELINKCREYQTGDSGHPHDDRCYSAIELVVKANGTEVARKLWRNPSKQNDNILPISETFTVNIPAGATLKAEASAVFSQDYEGKQWPKEDGGRAQVRLASVEYNAQSETIASTGSVQFMAVSNSSSAFDIEAPDSPVLFRL